MNECPGSPTQDIQVVLRGRLSIKRRAEKGAELSGKTALKLCPGVRFHFEEIAENPETT